MREMKIALAVLRQGDYFLLQRRGNIPKIGGAGLLGLFGGKIEKDESAVQAVCREVAEETSLIVTEKQARYMGEVTVTSDHNLEEVVVNAQVYEFVVDDDIKITAREGELEHLAKEEVSSQLEGMTTGTAATFRELIGV